MKKIKIYLISMLLFSSIYMIYAQEYKCFNFESSNEYTIWFSPKDLTYSDNNMKGGQEGYQIKFNQRYYEIFTPIFNEIFGYPYTGDVSLLSKIKITFYFGKDFEPYYFYIGFPTDRIEEFSGLEDKIYNFGKKCMQTNFQPFVEVWEEEKFKGSSFMVPLLGFYLYSEGKLNLY